MTPEGLVPRVSFFIGEKTFTIKEPGLFRQVQEDTAAQGGEGRAAEGVGPYEAG